MSEYKDIPEALFQQMEAYLNGSMPRAERTRFDKELAADTRLQEELNFVKAAMDMVATASLREDMDTWHEELHTPRRFSFTWIGIAAGIAIMLGTALWFALSQHEQPTHQLWKQYHRIDPGLPVPMSAEAEHHYRFYDAMVDYKVGKYEQAFAKWGALAATADYLDTLHFYQGAALYNLQQYQEAVAYFEQLTEAPESPFADKARLYLVLCLLKLNQPERIRALHVPHGSTYADTLKHIQDQI